MWEVLHVSLATSVGGGAKAVLFLLCEVGMFFYFYFYFERLMLR